MNLLLFTLFPFTLILMALLFRKRQNRGDIVGGDISLPKSLWLSYTIGTWFFFPFFFFFWNIQHSLEIILIFHLTSFWIRGVLELFMIYKWFNWSPRYGIGHDLFHLIGLISLLAFLWPTEVSRSSVLALAYIFSLIISTGFEIVFAILFYKIRGNEKHKIYFASNSQEWNFVNFLTSIAVILCYGLHFIHAVLCYEMRF